MVRPGMLPKGVIWDANEIEKFDGGIDKQRWTTAQRTPRTPKCGFSTKSRRSEKSNWAKNAGSYFQKLEILEFRRSENWSYRKVARHFGVNFPGLCASTICGWEREKESLQSSVELKGPDAFRHREHKHLEMRAALIEFLLNQELNKNLVIIYHLIKQKAAQIYQHLNYDPSERMTISDPYISTLLREIGCNGVRWAGCVSRRRDDPLTLVRGKGCFLLN